MRVIVAGGAGLIGRALCTRLIEDGHQPFVLTRGLKRRLPGGVRAVEWHPPQAGSWMEELRGAGALVNLAGASVGRWPWTAGRKRELVESRVDATRSLVAALTALAPDQRPEVLINGSGTDLYEGRDDRPADEATPPADTFLSRLCVAWEAEAQQAETLGLRVVLARTSLVVARDAPSVRRLTLPLQLFLGGPIGSGEQWVSWIDIADAVELMLWAIRTESVNGPVNVAAPDPRPQADFARALGAALRRPSWLRTPAWAVRLAMGEQSILALGSRRVWPAKALAAGFAFAYPRLEESLGRHLV